MFTAPPARGSQRLRQLDPDPADDALQRIGHDVRVRVAHDDVALAEIVTRRRLTGAREPRLDDEVTDVPLPLLDTMHGPDPAASHPAQVGGAGGVPAFRHGEPAEDRELGPGAVEVEVVC